MKLVLAVFHEFYRDRIRERLQSLDVPGFTEFRELGGSGETGHRYDTSPYPGRNAALMTVLELEAADRVVKELRAFKEGLPRVGERPGGIKIFVLPVDAVT